jgi:hypothetical protein
LNILLPLGLAPYNPTKQTEFTTSEDMSEETKPEPEFTTVPDIENLKRVAQAAQRITIARRDREGNTSYEKVDSYWFYGDL